MQTSFSNSLISKPYFLGQILDTSLTQVDSYAAETAISFGQPVQLGTDPTKQVKALVAGGTLWGIAIESNFASAGGVLSTNTTTEQVVNVTSNNTHTYPIGSMVPVVKVGRVVIQVGATVSQNTVGKTQAWYQTGSATASLIGTIRASDSDPTSSPETFISIGTFLSVPTANNLAVIQINKL